LSGSTAGCGTAKLKQCKGNLATCRAMPTGQVQRTVQTTCTDTIGVSIPCSGTGQDGELQKGLARHYVDNGDGTVTDLNTGLMWEKKSDDGSIHDQNNAYSWPDAFSVFIAGLNSGGGFAGHTDWRVPNVKELQSITTSRGCWNPPVDAVFDANCTPGCAVPACSCTPVTSNPLTYWSSTSYANPTPDSAWRVLFWCGAVTSPGPKTGTLGVRAVRGGS